MDLLLDTQVLVWIGRSDRRLSPAVRSAFKDASVGLMVSAVTAYEFADLRRRGRFGAVAGMDDLLRPLRAAILPYPADAWRLVDTLPDLHRDPIDRMVIAHALHDDLTLVTADATMRRYPVRTLW